MESKDTPLALFILFITFITVVFSSKKLHISIENKLNIKYISQQYVKLN